MPLVTQYQVLLVIESVAIDDESGENIPDSRNEVHCEVIDCTTSEDSAYDVVYTLQDVIQSAKNLAEKLNEEKNEESDS